MRYNQTYYWYCQHFKPKNHDFYYFSDKYVIIGAHIDSWTKGAVDSGTGYSVIWELARGFGALINGGNYLVSSDTMETCFTQT